MALPEQVVGQAHDLKTIESLAIREGKSELTTSRRAGSSGSFITIARPAQKGLAFRSASSIVSSSDAARMMRVTQAHAALGSALEGFSPTTEFPDIADGRALFEALAETDEVKAATKDTT